MKSFSTEIVKNLKFILKDKNKNLHEPELDEEDLNHINKCFKSGMISTAGNYVSKFENEIKKITKSKCCFSFERYCRSFYIIKSIRSEG
jgi:ribosomal protein S13